MNQSSGYTTLISAQALLELKQDINQNYLLLDCRATLGDPSGGRTAFNSGHIVGARHADLDTLLASQPGSRGRHPLPDRNNLAAAINQWGVAPNTQVVVYDDAGAAFAGRAWWCLRWLGHSDVAVLDGGLAAWSRLGKEQLVRGQVDEDVQTTRSQASHYLPRTALTRTYNADEVLELIAGPADNIHLLDARTKTRYEGLEEPIDAVAGHIPTALCYPFQQNLDDQGYFLPAEELQKRFAALPENIVCYCGSGVTAAHNVLALVIAGWPEPALYPGSWSEWIADSRRPCIQNSATPTETKGGPHS